MIVLGLCTYGVDDGAGSRLTIAVLAVASTLGFAEAWLPEAVLVQCVCD